MKITVFSVSGTAIFFLLIAVFHRDDAGAAAIPLPHPLTNLARQLLPHLFCVFPRHYQIKDQIDAGLALHNAKPRSNPLRGSKKYREHALPILVRRALEGIAKQMGLLHFDN